MKKKKTSGPPVPKPIRDHFHEARASHQRLLDIVQVSENGIRLMPNMPRLLEALADLEDKHEDPSSAANLEGAKKQAALAHTELAEDFPILHGLAVVALWSWLEHFAKGLVALWIVVRKDAINVPPIKRLRVRLGEYVSLSKIEQARFVVEMLERELASPIKRGVNRFEYLFEPFGLSGEVPQDCSDAIFELQEIRNVIAHRNGRVDNRLRSSCPHLKLKLDQPVTVTSRMFGNYVGATLKYFLTVLYRVGHVYGVDLKNRQADSTASIPQSS